MPNKIQKSNERLLQDLAENVDILYHAFNQLYNKPHFYKEVAARLFILVCETNNNKPLLFNLANKQNASLIYTTMMNNEYNLFDFIKNETQIINKTTYTNEKIIIFIRNQLGGGHEDTRVDEMHVFSEQIYINGFRSDIMTLKYIASTVIICAFDFLRENGFDPPR